MIDVQLVEEKKWWDLWLTSRDPDAGDLLVKRYTPLVSYHVQRLSVHMPKNVSRDELKSLGFLGLVDALTKFDPSRDLKFDTYASFRIRGAILDGLRKEDWLPRGTREKAKKIEAKIEELEQQFLRHVTAEEVANELDMSVEELQQIMAEYYTANILSMDDQIKDQEEMDGKGYDIKDDRISTPEEEVVKEELIQELSREIAGLSEKEKLVLSLFYQEELTLTEIGEILNLSTSRISQIHSKALFKLRNKLKKVSGIPFRC
ncbi:MULTISPECIES: FliA/WhiG family RNA polymerase sigma factor [Bacillus]|jgi:RNA polymerase sigma factor for flagellar operon FliA|uniref:FliA/WhiG family RNA polymerase sigma factor n=1 Tax=Bacillus TaxID=1386 RepID=UPI00065DC3C1|nr:FliA/WhiG family RNA polymerase sigma factor [Bacillus smithii]AKP46889.1 RNA polymerase sigma factor for flagellar operon [Bacillus smithii]MED0660574.1 FliA/WhiG family RNA polymerase sigma factor [Bacillus smithii]MED1419313.1 FliA/WhiG family RNA polymerase sigma factor [Bacillus smithii]MED1454944.1 FliA/WhiG family RNA polymerase sigma factor [Bacillus smithii]MED1488084.1 FliA/WhiG family RNA polymerase sigma factor [Bacillus smithii]